MNTILTETRSEILAELRSEMNGAVVESMLHYNGTEPFFSYGVSLPRIKQEALKHKGNHELALFLFQSEIRELKLAAIYVEIPENVTPQQMGRWSESFHSLEIADNAATMLFFGAPEALETAAAWIKEESRMRPALMIAGKRARLYKDKERDQYATLLQEITPLTRREHPRGILDAICYALTAFYKLFPKEVLEIRDNASTLPYIKASIMI